MAENRIAIVLTEHGEIDTIVSDAPITVLIVDPNCPRDRVYHYDQPVGPHHVQKHVAGYAVGHIDDGTFGISDGSGKRKPSRPALKIVGAQNG